MAKKVSTVSVTDGMTLHLGHAEGIAVRFSFIDPDAGTMMATHAMPSRADGDNAERTARGRDHRPHRCAGRP